MFDVLGMPWSPSLFPSIERKVPYHNPASGMSIVRVKMAPGLQVADGRRPTRFIRYGAP